MLTFVSASEWQQHLQAQPSAAGTHLSWPDLPQADHYELQITSLSNQYPNLQASRHLTQSNNDYFFAANEQQQWLQIHAKANDQILASAGFQLWPEQPEVGHRYNLIGLNEPTLTLGQVYDVQLQQLHQHSCWQPAAIKETLANDSIRVWQQPNQNWQQSLIAALVDQQWLPTSPLFSTRMQLPAVESRAHLSSLAWQIKPGNHYRLDDHQLAAECAALLPEQLAPLYGVDQLLTATVAQTELQWRFNQPGLQAQWQSHVHLQPEQGSHISADLYDFIQANPQAVNLSINFRYLGFTPAQLEGLPVGALVCDPLALAQCDQKFNQALQAQQQALATDDFQAVPLAASLNKVTADHWQHWLLTELQGLNDYVGLFAAMDRWLPSMVPGFERSERDYLLHMRRSLAYSAQVCSNHAADFCQQFMLDMLGVQLADQGYYWLLPESLARQVLAASAHTPYADWSDDMPFKMALTQVNRAQEWGVLHFDETFDVEIFIRHLWQLNLAPLPVQSTL